MQKTNVTSDLNADDLAVIAERAVRAIPPAWPLSSSVAVNPYLGQAHETLAQTSARLERVAGVRSTMPRTWYTDRIASGHITDDDLEAALEAATTPVKPGDLVALKDAIHEPSPEPKAVPNLAVLAARHHGTDWPGFIAERIGVWAASYFDQGQALWGMSQGGDAYTSWRAYATRDLTPEIIGLEGFAAHVDRAPETSQAAIARAVSRLGLREPESPTYFHALLMSLGGWAQLARYKLWQADLDGDTDSTGTDLLAIRLIWEEALYSLCGGAIERDWQAARTAHAAPLKPNADNAIDAILQEAVERAEQRRLGSLLSARQIEPKANRPELQAAFCIDVRSEVFRRALETVNPNIQTYGFAGFFGLPTSHRGFASDVEERRLPVLLTPQFHSIADGAAEKDRAARFIARAKRAWGRFKLAAVSSFAFVEAAGPIYIGKLVRDALGLTSPKTPDAPPPTLDPQLDPDNRADLAESVMRAMSLTENFAPIVVLAGHGAKVVNNPHASALHCGACGGYSGEVNARLLAGLLNNPEVRERLERRGIEIPGDTLFVGALHDTTTDQVTLFDVDEPGPQHKKRLAELRQWLDAAAKATSAERALCLPRARNGRDLVRRSQDWSEVRPEWALAGCKAFIAAPRKRTAGKNLAGRAFLHEYVWQHDQNFSVLELIMTAPVVVASWISLQYYGSTVAPEAFGGGNKLLHNVVGGIGVVEGNGGLLRAGLPWQSVHDGEKHVHDPLRLTVCIEAPREAMTDILRRYPDVCALFDNGWLHLFALDQDGRIAWRYAGGLEWHAVAADDPKVVREVA